MKGSQILLVDDEKYTLQLLEKIFQAEAYIVLTAQSGPEALEILETEKPNLIVLDIIMPDMDGLEVLKKLKENESTRKIPVIALTSRQDLDMKLTVLKDGALDYITKPFQKEELVYRVRNFLEYAAWVRAGQDSSDVFSMLFPNDTDWLSPEPCTSCQFGYHYPRASEVLQLDDQATFTKLDQWVIDGLLTKQYFDSVVTCPSCAHYHLTMHNVCPHCYAVVESTQKKHCRHCHSPVDEPVLRFKCIHCGKEWQRNELRTKKIFSYKAVAPAELPARSFEDEKNVDPTILEQVFRETQIAHVDDLTFRNRIHNEIEQAQVGNYYITVMSIHIENLAEVTEKYGRPMSIKLVKSIVLVVKKFIRKHDVISYNKKQQLLLLLPQMHYNMAKILAEKIQGYFEKIIQEVNLVVRLASYPEDGYDENEVLAMLDLGIEVVREKFTP